MRREIPLFLTFLFGAFFVVTFFFVPDRIKILTEPVNDWLSIIISFTYVLGFGNVVRIHSAKIAGRQPGCGYSIATLAGVAGLILVGVRPGDKFWGGFGPLTAWTMGMLQNAGKRAILIGAALGAVSTGVKIILGIEKSYLGGQ